MSRRIAIPVKHNTGIESIIDTRFGRAETVLIVDSDTRKIIETTKERLRSNGVSAVVSARFGALTYHALSELNIEMWIAPDGTTVDQALDLLATGTLQRCTHADVGRGAETPQHRTMKRWHRKYRNRKRLAVK